MRTAADDEPVLSERAPGNALLGVGGHTSGRDRGLMFNAIDLQSSSQRVGSRVEAECAEF